MNLWFAGLAVTVDSDSEDDLVWLAEFFGPGLERPTSADTSPLMRYARLVGDTDRYHRLKHLADRASANAPVFVLDGGPLDLPHFRDGDTTVIHDTHFSAFLVQRTHQMWEVVDDRTGTTCGPDAPRRGRSALMRIVREWAMHHARRAGALPLHAAGVGTHAGALLFAGPKKAGKTTLTAACLHNWSDAGLLANDRIMLSGGDGGWRCRGMASIVSIRPGSFEFLPSLRSHIERVATGHINRVGIGSTAALVDGRYALSPPQYCQALATRPIAELPLAAIGFPVIAQAERGIRASRLERAEAERLLAESLFACSVIDCRSAFFDVPEAGPWPQRTTVSGRVTALAASVPCFRLELGPDAYHPETIAALRSTLTR